MSTRKKKTWRTRKPGMWLNSPMELEPPSPEFERQMRAKALADEKKPPIPMFRARPKRICKSIWTVPKKGSELHICARLIFHAGQHQCFCGFRWTNRPHVSICKCWRGGVEALTECDPIERRQQEALKLGGAARKIMFEES